MTVQTDFRDDPHAFMQNNVVYVAFLNDTTGLVNLTIEARAPAGVVTNKVGGGVYKLRLARDGDAAPLAAYVCPYAQDSIQSVMLGNAAFWCFTPTMDGCTFGIGSQANGAVRVCHVNSNRGGAAVGSLGIDAHREQQRKLQRNFAKSKVGLNATLIEPDTYMAEGGEAYKLKSTTFGRHVANGPWTFFSQRYRYAGHNFFHGDVISVP